MTLGKLLYIFTFGIFNSCTADYPSVNLTGPHLVIISANHIDTTSLANVLLGKSPDCPDCLTDICSDMTTAAVADKFPTTPNMLTTTTKERPTIKPTTTDAEPTTSAEDTEATTTAEYNKCTTKFAVGDWLGESSKFSLFQAPNFGEPYGYDKVKNLVDILQNFAITNNRFLIAMDRSIDVKEDNFDNNLDQVLSQLGALFGREFWSRVALGAINWHYDIDSINARNKTGRGEEWWTNEMSSYIQQRFNVNANFSSVFIDADSKRTENLDDPLQTEAFERESGKLLDLMMTTLSMKMATLQETIDELNSVINNTLVDMQSNIDRLMKDMTEVQDDVIDNGIDISYVKGVVSLNQIDIETHDRDLQDIHRNVQQQRKDLEDIHRNVQQQRKDLEDIQNNTNVVFGLRGFECIDDIILTIPSNITSANYPDNYPRNVDCTFTLIPQGGTSVHLEFPYFRTISSNSYMEITPDGGSVSTYSGTTVPPATDYKMNQSVVLHFHTYPDTLYNQEDIYKFHAIFAMI